MKVLLTRVSKGSVSVGVKIIGSIDKGLALFVGITKGDNSDAIDLLCKKVINLRVFENEEGKLHYSLKDKNYSILCISNFTLYANTDKGRRPSFDGCLASDLAKELFNEFVDRLRYYGINVETGVFGAHMDIKLDMDGPVNILLDNDLG